MDNYCDDASRVSSGAVSSWREALSQLGTTGEPSGDQLRSILSTEVRKDLRYYLNLQESRLRDRLVLDLMTENEDGQDVPVELVDGDPSGLGEADADIVSLLFGAHGETRGRGQHARDLGLGRCAIRPSLYRRLLPQISRTGRFFADLGLANVPPAGPVEFVPRPSLSVRLVIHRCSWNRQTFFRLWGVLVSADARYDLEQPRLLLSDGLALVDKMLYTLPTGHQLDWALRLRRHGPVEFPEVSKDQFVQELSAMPGLPDVEMPPELHWSRLEVPPRPKMVFFSDLSSEQEEEEEEETQAARAPLTAKVLFEYGGLQVAVGSFESAILDEAGRRWFRRDLPSERVHIEKLRQVDVQADGASEVRIERKNLSEVIKALVAVDWSVETEGALVRTNGKLHAKVYSGIDWFELDADVTFAPDAKISLPKLLRGASVGKDMVRLSDGTRGLIPKWIKKYSAVARFGKTAGERLRFLPSQAGVIDVLLAGHEHTSFDLGFEELRAQLDTCSTAKERIQEPEGFKGKLRDYQSDGVGWMQFLANHNYGGCLADDMGLGKTVQVLCLLQGRHSQGSDESRPPSLVVVPKSLVHNWVEEAAKFTQLEVLNYTGARRGERSFSEVDVIVTTYGTLRQEILYFTGLRWTTVVLDEAQAIKNPRSQAAKACRLLQADLRLAISGTPIENGLEELWSLFEFLNPGMLGSLGDFADTGRESSEDWLRAMSRALKPFMLRRTKDEVLKELPGKTEHLWSIPLGEEERKNYDELCRYYQHALRGVLSGEDDNPQSRVHVLEALLRLRQAACHPGLIDAARMDEPSAKLDALFDKLEQIVPRGHKVLIFSQFTSLLEIVRRRLVRHDIGYAYLDGGTSDRQKTVSEFTDNKACSVFLISLKAGGCGLNLTQSDYVFILDPWWNPAIEAQAVDRAYRMGQKNRVFAYKMVAEDTVEQKIVALQLEKRRLADTVVNTPGGPLTQLDAEDLAVLLG
ncbi:MAG: DEAD/DEAH box helicase [Myxococcales bacterium]|nr:DEAD/DEAH box helicase [Myxococcales bacterium]